MIWILTFWLASATPALPITLTADAGMEACQSSLHRLPFDDSKCLAVLADAAQSDAHALVHQHLAIAYVRIRDLPKAEAQMAAASALQPDTWEVLANTGYVHLYLNRFREAHEAFSQAMQVNPDFPLFLLLNRALASQGLGRFADAAEDVSLYETYSTPQDPCASEGPACSPVPIVGPHQVQ